MVRQGRGGPGNIFAQETTRFLQYLHDHGCPDTIKRDDLKIIYNKEFVEFRRNSVRDYMKVKWGEVFICLRRKKLIHELGDFFILGKDVQSLYENLAGSEEHRQTLEEWKEKAKVTPYFCEVCGVQCPNEKNFDIHKNGARHRIHKFHYEINRNREQLIYCPDGIAIHSDPTVNDKCLIERKCGAREELYMSISVINNSKINTLVFQRYLLLWDTGVFHLLQKQNQKAARFGVNIGPGGSYEMLVKCKAPEDFGHHFVPIAFYFGWKDRRGQIIAADAQTQEFVVRFVSVHVLGDLHEELAPTAPFQYPDQIPDTAVETVVPGEECPKSIIMDKFYYSSLPDISHKVKWPVKLVSSSRVRSDKVTVYCLSDDAYFDVSLNQLVNFPSSKISLKSKALLKKKPKTLESFIADEKWAKSEQVKAKKAHVSDRTEERSHEQNQSHSTLAYEENEKVQADEKLERIKNGRGHRLCTQKRKNEETSIERNKKRTLRKRINVGTVKKKCSETGKEQSEFTVTLETEAVQNVKEIELEQNKNHSTFVCEENEKTEVDKKSEGIDSARRQPCRQKRKNEDTGIHTNKKRISGKRMGDRTVKQQCTETRNEQSEVTVTAETESVQNIDEKGHEQSQSYSTVVCMENESNSNVVCVDNEKAEVDEKSEKINSGIGHGQCTQKRINADAKTDRIKNKMEHGQRELTVTTESDNVRNIEEREHKERDSIVCEEGEKQRLDERTEGTNIETLHVQSELIVAKKDADENTGEQEHWQSEKTVETCEKDENDDKSEYEESLFDDVDNDKDFQPYSSESECSEEFSESELQPTTSRLALLSGSENRIEAVDDSTSDSDQSQVFPMLVRPFQRSIHDDDSSQMLLRQETVHEDDSSQTLLCQGTVHEKDSSPTLLYQGTLHKEDSSDTCSDDDIFSEADVVRDEFRPGIYIRKVVKSESSKTGRGKKSDRVYNSRNVCPFCLKKQTNFSHHIFSKKHENEKEVRRIIKISQELDGPNYMKKKKTAIEMLRMSGNHMHNMKVIEKMKGELILARRNSSTYFNHKEYGPCPTCFGWMLYKTFRRHSKTCPGNICNNNSDNGSVSMSAVALAVQSDILTGRISKHASKALVSEVFSIMQDDEVSRVAQSDSLIVSLGNQWLKRNMGNRIMRKYYTSQVMRLAARLLIELKKGAVNGENSLEQFLSPPYFTAVAEAALVCAKQNLNDDENLASPSNAVKLGYDIKRMASAKLANAIVEKNEIARREGKDFLSLMNMEWGFRVKKQAVVLLTERQFNKKTALPLPADIKVLAQHMDDTLKTFNCDDVTQSNFRLAATYALAKLTLYNRRRSHEVQALRVATYKQKISGFDQVSVDLFHQLSAWEKQLIETQDVVEIRGKRGRRVPVIIPQQVKVVMEYLVCPRVREAAGVPSVNPYVFASGVGVVRAYDAIRKVTSSGGLEMPSLIRTTNMRKFMATMIQSLETTETQRQWIIDHLGHNMDIHLTYYRQQSDIIERVEVAKLLLIQDLKKSKEFAGKKLEEIQIEDIFTPENIPTEDNTLDEHETTVIPDLYSFEEEEESRLGGHTLAKRHPANPVKRQRWSSEDEEELKKLFTVNFESLKCPNTKDIKIAVKKSLKSNGSIHKRTIENIKKKVCEKCVAGKAEALPTATIPCTLGEIWTDWEREDYKHELDTDLRPENYKKKFDTLLWVEELQMVEDIKRYDLIGVEMVLDMHTQLMVLEVPGLMERRPSVLKGDKVFIFAGADRSVRYEAFVHKVELENVYLGVGARLKKSWLRGMTYDVRFDFARFNLWVQHRAVSEFSYAEAILFPSTQNAFPSRAEDVPMRPWFDKQLNPEQQVAVTNIVQGTSRPGPYLIFGPPGTGKTVTVTEAIRQVYHCQPAAKILVCCPENTAADFVMKKLINPSLPGAVQKNDVFRMYAVSRSYIAVPAEIKDSRQLNYDEQDKDFFYPGKEELKKYKILILTLSTSGRLVTADFPRNFYTHIFIDEGAHAIEPECCIPITGLLDANKQDCGQLVIAGDPRQLGPILRSPFAINYGLETSILERYMDKEPQYSRSEDTGYDANYVTKLVRNYRSHDAIISVPRRLFYDKELEACGDPMILNSMLNWTHLPNKKFPVIFHAVFGNDEREKSSPSFFNRDEISQVEKYLELLLKEKKSGQKIKPKDIGIISPYRKQVQKIRMMVEKKFNIKGEIMVGSVEEFQGQECKIIIISTVRSNANYVQKDLQYHLGFVKNPKRFNVALTRARALLIVIGNPMVLEQDHNWKIFLDYCDANGAFKGQHGKLKPGGNQGNGNSGDGFGEIYNRVASLQIQSEDPQWEIRN